MAYPFTKATTLGEFVAAALAVGASNEEVRMQGPRGDVTSRYLVVSASPTRVVPLPNLQDTDFLTPNVLRSLCNQAGLDLDQFGLHLN